MATAVPGLLGLPVELKEQILEYVLVPTLVDSSGIWDQSTDDVEDAEASRRRKGKGAKGYCLLATLLVSKQLNDLVLLESLLATPSYACG